MVANSSSVYFFEAASEACQTSISAWIVFNSTYSYCMPQCINDEMDFYAYVLCFKDNLALYNRNVWGETMIFETS